ncbi:MAG: hypothetical protein AVDCRST_MAG72-2398 [uncultured Nocardioidaceae bacterium]|uniref:3-methyladenine DNA glycosylase n=1 Tax=uncultured Nocardioidaceae bacterium TaxID=253824 RepID=A0A6J4MP43_9ACTN|nr:MAG: hypothetical protein AVDCRST_MAG72-2398 [uncultured Nocardioidaceae bacterium]
MDERVSAPPEVLEEPIWRARRDRHEERVDGWVGPHLHRRRERREHPVEDFLFTYYSQRPASLRRWHPGFGVGLREATEYAGVRGYEVVGTTAAVSPAHVDSRLRLVRSVLHLLTATAKRPAQLSCFGMHEWAMVYRLDPAQVRHATWPLRLGAPETDEVVRNHRIACSHFDAFRFFTPSARPLNQLQPERDDRAAFEQPGCLHAGMDLYKHSFRLSPMVPSELVADCFELARAIRVLDMRASPYDLSTLGYAPVRVETPAGKAEYVAAQRGFAERARPLRARLIVECRRLLAAHGPGVLSR